MECQNCLLSILMLNFNGCEHKMPDHSDLLKKLDSADSLEQTAWIITDQLLSSMPDVRDAVLAAAIPHWFNKDVLDALLDRKSVNVDSIYERIIGLSFVEPHGILGYRLHDLTRK